MKKQIIYMVCATALLSSCHIYKAYDRPDTIETSGIYRDPVSAAGLSLIHISEPTRH